VLIGQFLLYTLLLVQLSLSKSVSCHDARNRSNLVDKFIWPTVRVACSSVWSGFVWQANVNLAIQYSIDFSGAFFIVWSLSGLTFFVAYVLHGYLIQNYAQSKIARYSTSDFWHDAEISIAVGCSAACFVGTSVRGEFKGNWLAPLFGEPDEESLPLPAMLAAGASTVFGFCLCQLLICLLLWKRDSWTDHH
jgi:hypothetical protein